MAGVAQCVGWGLAALPADAQVVCAKTHKRGKTKFKLRDACKDKETVAIDLTTTSSGLDSRVTDLETNVTVIDGDVAALASDVDTIESDPDGDTGWTCELLRTEDVASVSKWTAGVLCCE